MEPRKLGVGERRARTDDSNLGLLEVPGYVPRPSTRLSQRWRCGWLPRARSAPAGRLGGIKPGRRYPLSVAMITRIRAKKAMGSSFRVRNRSRSPFSKIRSRRQIQIATMITPARSGHGGRSRMPSELRSSQKEHTLRNDETVRNDRTSRKFLMSS